VIDYDRFARERLGVLNGDGGRGYDQGIRIFHCPVCGERKGRGWMGITAGVVGCYNAGCDADPTLRGGAAELLRRMDDLPDASTARRALRARYGTDALVVIPPKPFDGADFVRYPEGVRPFEVDGGVMQDAFEAFASGQWDLGPTTLREWGFRWALTGELAWRIIIPVLMDGRAVGWQARSVRGADPKYVTSRRGKPEDPRAQCGRPAAAMLFNVDAVLPGSEVLMVEGAASAVAWHRRDRGRTPTAVALLGVALTAEKAALVASKEPERVVVALDPEPDAQRRARDHVDALRAWGLDATLGRWVGAKGIAEGASLDVLAPSPTRVAENFAEKIMRETV
jgi:hypothetical protein